MIDLEKEREAFEKYMGEKCSRFVDVRRVLNGDIGEYMAWDMTLGFKLWIERAKLANAEIDSLKAQLAKLESGEYVIVPKEPTEAMIKHAYGTYEGAAILPYSFYKAMIEAEQEQNND